MGNHEQGLINIHYLTAFNQPARDALRKTREMITEGTYQWLVSHPKSLVLHDCRFVHGTPPDSASDYIWKHENHMDAVFTLFSEPICFVGHTHDLVRFTFEKTPLRNCRCPKVKPHSTRPCAIWSTSGPWDSLATATTGPSTPSTTPNHTS